MSESRSPMRRPFVVRFSLQITRALATAITLAAVPTSHASEPVKEHAYPFQNPTLSTSERTEDLLARLTLEEKASLMKNASPGIPRLSLPPYEWWNEALHGVARAGKATVFPQATGLAATWDVVRIEEVGTTIAAEARAKYEEVRGTALEGGRYRGLTFWSPNINLYRDPRWGRGQETFGEDPVLTGNIGSAFVVGLQGHDREHLRVAACAKHFAAHSGPEANRYRFNVKADEADLYESYLPAFETLVKQAHVEGVMTAYNAINGVPCTANPFLFSLLKKWDFDGYTVSDCGAVYCLYEKFQLAADYPEAEALAVKSGLNLRCGSGDAQLAEAVRRGLITEAELNNALRNLLRTWCRLGLLDKAAPRPANIARVETPEHVALAKRTAEESIVLLKNNGLLPLKKKSIRSLLVVGPNAASVECLLGNYHGTPTEGITVIEGLRRYLGKDVRILNAHGCDYAEARSALTIVPRTVLNVDCACLEGEGEDDFSGLVGVVFEKPNFEGRQVSQRHDHQIEFASGSLPGAVDVSENGYSVRWTGALKVGNSGTYHFRLTGQGTVLLQIDGTTVLSGSSEELSTTWEGAFSATSGKAAKVLLQFSTKQKINATPLNLQWTPPPADAGFSEALAAAKEADVILYAGGLSPELEGEDMRVDYDGFASGDRTRIELPEIQQRLLTALARTGKPVIFANFSGGAVAWPKIENDLAAILQCWYPGQQGGAALASLLFGEVSPSGHLPVTFYRSTEDLPAFEDYHMKGRTYRYYTGTPLYPFGHGLSYTTFTLSRTEVASDGSRGACLKVSVTNTGSREGTEVVQAYLIPPESPSKREQKSLAGFTKITLKPGETREVTLALPARAFTRWDSTKKELLPVPGRWTVQLGNSSAAISVIKEWIQE